MILPEESNQVERQHRLGKLTARERLSLLCDEGSFEEHDAGVATSVITGRGEVHGRIIFFFAQDQTYDHGALSSDAATKIVALQKRAIEARAPLIGLFDSEGLQNADGVGPLPGYGEMIRHHIEASGVIPQIALVLGPCIGAEAFHAQLMDLIIMTEETSALFVTGPEIVGQVTGHELTSEELGGAGFHATNGSADAIFKDEIAALSQVRRLIDFLPSGSPWRSFDVAARSEPFLDRLIPLESATPYDIRPALLKIVDEGDFFELQEMFAQNIIVGLGRMMGQTTGFIANQPLVLGGVLDVKAMRKATRFIHFCEALHIPLVTLVDAPGFLPGLDQEEAGLAEAGADLLRAYARASVRKVTLILGQAYGAAFTMMGARALGAAKVLAWPSAHIGLSKAGKVLSAREAQEQAVVDAVIAPSATRAHLIEALFSKG